VYALISVSKCAFRPGIWNYLSSSSNSEKNHRYIKNKIRKE
jgi:hypothetical protein